MEFDCYCRVRFKNDEQFELAKMLIEAHPDSPLLDSEVEKELRTTFNALEIIESSKDIYPEKEKMTLTIHWMLRYYEDATEVVNCLINAKVENLFTLILNDEGCTYCYVHSKGKTSQLKEFKGRVISKIGVRTNIYNLLENIESHYN